MERVEPSAKKIVIFGASGQTGVHLVKQGIEKGYKVRALVRSREKAAAFSDQVELYIGDATDADTVSRCIEGQDVVLCAVGGHGLKDSSTRSRITEHIIASMKQHGVPRLIVCSVLGLGKSVHHLSWFSRLFVRFVLKHVMEDHRRQEELIKNSALDVVVFRPPQLIDGEKTERYRLADEEEPFRGSKINRGDVAHAMITAIDSDEWLGKYLSISN